MGLHAHYWDKHPVTYYYITLNNPQLREIHCSNYLRGHVCVFFIPHSRGLIQLFLLKFWVKQWSGRMLHTTASKHLRKLWKWPHVHSVEKSSLFPSIFWEVNITAHLWLCLNWPCCGGLQSYWGSAWILNSHYVQFHAGRYLWRRWVGYQLPPTGIHLRVMNWKLEYRGNWWRVWNGTLLYAMNDWNGDCYIFRTHYLQLIPKLVLQYHVNWNDGSKQLHALNIT